MNKIKKVIIPAAGLGTRFLPATKALPKEMLPIIDKPTLQYIVEEALQSGIEEFIIIISSNKNSIMDYFDRNLELEGLTIECENINLFLSIFSKITSFLVESTGTNSVILL